MCLQFPGFYYRLKLVIPSLRAWNLHFNFKIIKPSKECYKQNFYSDYNITLIRHDVKF